jgi:hypothetical protein
MAMVVVPSGAFHAGHDDVAAITTAYDTLAPLLGAPAASAFLEAADFGKGSEWWSLEQQPVAYYRAAAARARRLQAEATTPRLKQYLGEVIARCERLAGEVESASKKH